MLTSTTQSVGPHHSRTKPSRKISWFYITTALLLTTIPLFLYTPASLLTTLRLPRCGHITLISDQRHGSTWFISNADGCTSQNGSYGLRNKNTELWNHGTVRDIQLSDAVDLVRYNTSVKLFPQALYDHPDRMRAFLKEIKALRIPVFVLRRRVKDCYASFQAAIESGVWDADAGRVGRGARARGVVRDKKFVRYRDKVNAYFKDAKKVLEEVGVRWDEVLYERVVGEKVIVGRNGGCYIRNCNF